MTGLPLMLLQERLDVAFRLHPQSRTLADLRADGSILEAEAEALQQARRIITPHTEIAALYLEKSVLIDWAIPAVGTQIQSVKCRGVKLVFPSASVGRKGAYELRTAMNGLNAELMILGPTLEGTDFWSGVRVCEPSAGEVWFQNGAAVVLPAFVEHKPRRLLEAVAWGVPVIASSACGLRNIKGVTIVEAGDIDALRSEIEKAIAVGRK
jgi:Glycosyl transferases group 1